MLKVNSSTAFGRYAVIPHLHEFIEAYPELQVQFTNSDSMVDLVGDGVDVGLRIGTLTDSSLIARRLAPVKRVVAGAPAYFERHGVPKTPDDLARHNCLRVSFETTINRWEFKGADGPRILDVNGSLVVNDASLLYDAALAGVGLIRAAQFLTWEALREGRLVPVLQEYETEEDRSVFAVYPPGRFTQPKVRAFIDFQNDTTLWGWTNVNNRISLNHQSNGRSDPLSRSWNRVIGTTSWINDEWALAVSPFWRIPEDDSDDDNPDIELPRMPDLLSQAPALQARRPRSARRSTSRRACSSSSTRAGCAREARHSPGW